MIGLIFGETDFPKIILKKIRKIKKKYLIIDLTKKKTFRKDECFNSVSIGQIGKIIEILKANKCKKVLFAGRVNKPNFSKIKLDLKGVYYIPKIIKASKIGDAAILKEIINIFKKEQIKTINSLTFNPDLSLSGGIHTKTKPNYDDRSDIKIAIMTLNKLNSYNFSQGTVVRNQKILAIEGKSGTQKMLSKIKKNQGVSKGVLVKFPKKKQDLRIDLPTIGLKTLIQCKRKNLKGVVLKKKQNVCLDKKKLISFANKNKIFISCV
ncbi:MAG: UDP-2,3-diacylglucosamine diphosphatase LpxI [Pelagibacteraceae bacterium]|jgi:UDP-2,3-diacylglucosamine hydrolase|nr:UDP-2,3-diacylglucosamine diphosphatase LpxI [Pelagibacteraceae bacterium]